MDVRMDVRMDVNTHTHTHTHTHTLTATISDHLPQFLIAPEYHEVNYFERDRSNFN